MCTDEAVMRTAADFLGVAQSGQSSCLGSRVPLVQIQPSRPNKCAVARAEEHPSDTRKAGGSTPLSATTLRLLVQSRRCHR